MSDLLRKAKEVNPPLQINAAICVTIHVSAPVSTSSIQSGHHTLHFSISHDHISMIIIPEVFISGKKFGVYKFTVSHFFFIYNNDPNSSLPSSHTLSFQLPPLLVALPVPWPGDPLNGCASQFSKGCLPEAVKVWYNRKWNETDFS